MSERAAVRVTGSPTAQELVAVLAAVHAFDASAPEPSSGYDRWRAGRIAALRASRPI